MEATNLIAQCRELGVMLAPGPHGGLRATPPGAIPEELRTQLQEHKAEVVAALKHREDGFLRRHVPEAALETFGDWRGLLVKSLVLDMSVWLVRCRPDGEALAHETGQPALILDDVLAQRGLTPQQARTELLPLLITGQEQ